VMNVVLSGLFTSLQVTLTNEVIISAITTVVAALVMVTSVRVVALLNSIGVVLEMVVLIGAAIGLLFHNHQSLSVLTTTGGVQGKGSYIVPFLVVIALVVTQLVGFETAGAFAEETKQARIKPSQAIIAGLAGTALLLFIFDLALILSLPNVGAAMSNPNLIPSVLTADLGSGFTKLFLVGALISVFSTAIATLATIVRTIYGMARNGQLPGSKTLTRLSPRTDEPIAAIVVAVVLSLIPLIFIKRVDVLVAAITGMIIVPLHPGARLAALPPPHRLAQGRVQVQPAPLGPAGHRDRARLDDLRAHRRGLAAGGHQPQPGLAAGHRVPGHRGDRRRHGLVVREPARQVASRPRAGRRGPHRVPVNEATKR
jgi:amino acid transporter